MQRWADDNLPYCYQDGALQVDTLRKQFASADPLHAYLSDSALFAELASDKAFHELVTRRVASLQQWLKQPELAAV
jgi:D-arabinitol 4-dehydrogenase